MIHPQRCETYLKTPVLFNPSRRLKSQRPFATFCNPIWTQNGVYRGKVRQTIRRRFWIRLFVCGIYWFLFISCFKFVIKACGWVPIFCSTILELSTCSPNMGPQTPYLRLKYFSNYKKHTHSLPQFSQPRESKIAKLFKHVYKH